MNEKLTEFKVSATLIFSPTEKRRIVEAIKRGAIEITATVSLLGNAEVGHVIKARRKPRRAPKAPEAEAKLKPNLAVATVEVKKTPPATSENLPVVVTSKPTPRLPR